MAISLLCSSKWPSSQPCHPDQREKLGPEERQSNSCPPACALLLYHQCFPPHPPAWALLIGQSGMEGAGVGLASPTSLGKVTGEVVARWVGSG